MGSTGRLADLLLLADTLWYHWVSRDPVAACMMVISARIIYNLDIVYWPPLTNPQDSLPNEAQLSVQLMDSAGKVRAILMDEWSPAGKQVLTILREGLPSGIYLLRISKGLSENTLRMLIR